MDITSNEFDERLNIDNIEDFYKASCAALKFLAETEVISLREIESRYPVFYRQSVKDLNKDEIYVKVPTYKVFIIQGQNRTDTAVKIYTNMKEDESIKDLMIDLALDKEDWKIPDVKTAPSLCSILCKGTTFEKNKQLKEKIKEIVNIYGYTSKVVASYIEISFKIEFLDNDKNNFKIVKENNKISFLY